MAVWSFTICLALTLRVDNERHAPKFIIYSFIGFYQQIYRQLPDDLLQRAESADQLFGSWSRNAGVLMPILNLNTVYATVGVSALFGPC